MNCPNCQTSVQQGSLLCPSCGYHVATAYQRNKVNSLISDRPGVVRRSFRSGGFIFLAILMSIISLATLVQMVYTIKETVTVFDVGLQAINELGAEPALIVMLVITAAIAIISILTFSLALASAVANWQNVAYGNHGLQTNHLSSMGSYLGLQKLWAVILAVVMIFSCVFVTIGGLLLGELISESGAEIAEFMQGMGIDSTEWLGEFEDFVEDNMAEFAIVMLVANILTIWISVAHVRVFGKSVISIKRLIGVLDPNSQKGKEWNIKRVTPVVGPFFFGIIYIVVGVRTIFNLKSFEDTFGEYLEGLEEVFGTSFSGAVTSQAPGAVISVALGLYLIVFALYICSVRRQLRNHERTLYAEQQNLATIESNTAMEIRNIRISQEHQQRQDAERRRQAEIQRHADEEEQRRMIRLAQEEQQQMMQQLMLSMNAIKVPDSDAAENEEAPQEEDPQLAVDFSAEPEPVCEQPAAEETVYEASVQELVVEEPALEEQPVEEAPFEDFTATPLVVDGLVFEEDAVEQPEATEEAEAEETEEVETEEVETEATADEE